MALSGEGVAVQIVNCNENERPNLTLNIAALRDVVQGLEEEPVVVLSIAGEYRTGKSFLLNFLIRYLEALEHGNVENWLKDPDVPLKGFDWAPGSDRTTIGIHLWNRPYHVTLPDQRRVAVLLMDTQGLFDDKTAPEDAATIFALSTMISSIQVYNILRNIGENHLKHLELFVETGRLVLDAKSGKSTPAEAKPSLPLKGETKSGETIPSLVRAEGTTPPDTETTVVPGGEPSSSDTEPTKETTFIGGTQILKEETVSEDKEPSHVLKRENVSTEKEPLHIFSEETISDDKEPSQVLNRETVSEDKEPLQVLSEETMSEDKGTSQVLNEETMSENKKPLLVLKGETNSEDKETSQVLNEETFSEVKEPSHVPKRETTSENKEPTESIASSAVTHSGETTQLESASYQVLSEETNSAGTISQLKTEEPSSIDTKPFQRLVYLVRDWNDPRKHKFGSLGGESYLRGKLMVNENQPEVLRKVRYSIHSCFEQVECFLMPNPGQRATESCASESEEEGQVFSGKLTELHPRFVKKLEELAPFLLEPKRLHPKQYDTKVLTGRDLCDNILRYMSIFQSGTLPQPTSTKEVMLMEFNTMIISELVDNFKKKLCEINVTSPSLRANPDPCYLRMENEKNEAIETFERKARGNRDEIKQFRDKLDETLSCLLQAKSAEIKKAILECKEADDQYCHALLYEEKARYEVEMKQRIQDQYPMKRADIEQMHKELKEKANLSMKDGMRGRLVDAKELICKLKESLDNVFDTIVSQNDARLADMKHREAQCENASLQAEQNYKLGIDKICGEGYVDPDMLAKQHETEARNALEAYDQSTALYPEYADRSRETLQDKLQQLYHIYIERNEKIIQIQTEQFCRQKLEIALLKYRATMDEQAKLGPYKADVLKTLHKSAASSASSFYQHETTNQGKDRLPYEEELMGHIEEIYKQYICKNDAAVAEQEKAIAELKKIKADVKSRLQRDFERLCGYEGENKPSANDLKLEHPSYNRLTADMKEELQEFLFEKRQAYLDHMERKAELRRKKGELVCREAKNRAFDKYERIMDRKCRSGGSYKSQTDLRDCHDDAREEAETQFLEDTMYYPNQRYDYQTSLYEQIKRQYQYYKEKNELNKQRVSQYVSPSYCYPQAPANTPAATKTAPKVVAKAQEVQNEVRGSWWGSIAKYLGFKK